MVKLVFYESEEKELRGFLICGHAGYASEGEDIVCAGVSALVQTGIVGLKHFLDEIPLIEDQSSAEDDGFIKVILPADLTKEDKRTAKVILETMELGMLGIARGYEKYLDVRRDHTDDNI